MIYMRIEIKVTVNTTPKSLKKGEGDRSLSKERDGDTVVVPGPAEQFLVCGGR